MAKKTPWGDADYETQIVPRAVTWVTTARHGGMMISKGWATRHLTEACLEEALIHGNYYCFEEDCAWALPAYENNVIFNALLQRGVDNTVETLRSQIDGYLGNYYKDYLAKQEGTFSGLRFCDISKGDILDLKNGITYQFVYKYEKKAQEWVAIKNGKLIRICWEFIRSQVKFGKAEYIRNRVVIDGRVDQKIPVDR